MVHCVAFGCASDSSKTTKNEKKKITFHKFPKDGERRASWIKALRRENWVPSSTSRICSIHFRESFMDRTSLSHVRLRENAIPEIFLGYPRRLQKLSKERQSSKKNVESSPDVNDGEPPVKTVLFRIGLHIEQRKVLAYQRKITMLNQKQRRLKQRLATLKETLEDFQNRNLLTKEQSALLDGI